MKTSIISILLSGILVLPIATTAFGGAGHGHLPRNTHETMTPEERKLANERRIPFETRINRMKVLIERAQASQDVSEKSHLLEQHLEEMQQGLAKIDRMKHVRTNSDRQRRINMTQELIGQLTAHQTEQERMMSNSTNAQMQEVRQTMEKIVDMRYVRTNAEINRKVGMMRTVMEQMMAYQGTQKRIGGESVSIQTPYGTERVGVANLRNQ